MTPKCYEDEVSHEEHGGESQDAWVSILTPATYWCCSLEQFTKLLCALVFPSVNKGNNNRTSIGVYKN